MFHTQRTSSLFRRTVNKAALLSSNNATPMLALNNSNTNRHHQHFSTFSAPFKKFAVGRTKNVHANIDDLWTHVSDFKNITALNPAMFDKVEQVGEYGIGMIRNMHFADNAGVLSESLTILEISADSNKRELGYDFVSNGVATLIPAKDYDALMILTKLNEGQTNFQWSAHFNAADGMTQTDAELQNIILGVYDSLIPRFVEQSKEVGKSAEVVCSVSEVEANIDDLWAVMADFANMEPLGFPMVDTCTQIGEYGEGMVRRITLVDVDGALEERLTLLEPERYSLMYNIEVNGVEQVLPLSKYDSCIQLKPTNVEQRTSVHWRSTFIPHDGCEEDAKNAIQGILDGLLPFYVNRANAMKKVL